MVPKKGQYSKAIVVLVIALNVIFTAAVIYVFSITGNEPTVLVGSWFAWTTGELWMLTSIKKKKVEKKKGEFECSNKSESTHL